MLDLALDRHHFNKISNSAVISLLLTLIWFFFPIPTIFLILYCIYKLPPKFISLNYLCFLIALSCGLIAYTAVSVDRGGEATDITRYTTQFNLLSEVDSFGEFLITTFITDGGIYIVFQLITLLLSKLFKGNPQILPLFWVTLTYFFLLLGVIELSKFKKNKNNTLLLILLITILFGTTLFTLEVELIKQSAAMSMAAYCMFRKLNGKSCWKIFILALFIHISVLIFAAVLIFINKKAIAKYWILIMGFSLIMSMIEINKVLGLILGGSFAVKANFYASIDSMTISRINYFLFFVYCFLLIIHIWAYRKNKERDIEAIKRFNFNLLCFCILIIQHGTIPNFVRYNYLYSPFYMFAFFCVIKCEFKKKEKIGLIASFIVIMLLINAAFAWYYLNSNYTNSYMDNSLGKITTSNVFDFLNFEAHN